MLAPSGIAPAIPALAARLAAAAKNILRVKARRSIGFIERFSLETAGRPNPDPTVLLGRRRPDRDHEFVRLVSLVGLTRLPKRNMIISAARCPN